MPDNTSDHRLISVPRRAGILALALAVSLAGCATTPLPDLAVPLPDNWRAQQRLDTTPAPDPRQWWKRFDDPQLNLLVDQAMIQNLDVRAAAARLQAVRAQYRRLDWDYLPEVHARTADSIDPDASASFFVAGFDAAWELGVFGRTKAAGRIAHGGIMAATADAQDAQLSLVAEVVRTWIDLRLAQQQVLLTTRIRDARQQQLDILATRVRLELAATSQFEQTRALVADSSAALNEPQQQENNASQALAVLLGMAEPATDWLRAGPLPQAGTWHVAAVPTDLLRTRPDIARSEALVVQAAGELGLARAEQYPSVGLGGSLRWSTNVSSHRTTVGSEAIAAFGPIIDIPLFDWGMRHAKATAKADELLATTLAYKKAVLCGVADVESALGAVEHQRNREENDRQAWQSRVIVAQAAATRERLGLGSRFDSMDRNIERDQSELELLSARSGHDLAYVSLFKALGGAPITPIASAREGLAP